jgi:hypothetical protein
MTFMVILFLALFLFSEDAESLDSLRPTTFEEPFFSQKLLCLIEILSRYRYLLINFFFGYFPLCMPIRYNPNLGLFHTILPVLIVEKIGANTCILSATAIVLGYFLPVLLYLTELIISKPSKYNLLIKSCAISRKEKIISEKNLFIQLLQCLYISV